MTCWEKAALGISVDQWPGPIAPVDGLCRLIDGDRRWLSNELVQPLIASDTITLRVHVKAT